MFSSIGWGEIVVLVLAGLFILGPERLPEAAAFLGRTIRQVKNYANGAQSALRDEFGSDFDELREPLQELSNGRGRRRGRAVLDALSDIDDNRPR